MKLKNVGMLGLVGLLALGCEKQIHGCVIETKIETKNLNSALVSYYVSGKGVKVDKFYYSSSENFEFLYCPISPISREKLSLTVQLGRIKTTKIYLSFSSGAVYY